MVFRVLVTDRDLADIREQTQSMIEFSQSGAQRFRRLIRRKLRSLAGNALLYAVKFRDNEGGEYRCATVMSRSIFFSIEGETLTVLRVFGPGQDIESQMQL